MLEIIEAAKCRDLLSSKFIFPGGLVVVNYVPKKKLFVYFTHNFLVNHYPMKVTKDQHDP
jgi:hypothetical protein